MTAIVEGFEGHWNETNEYGRSSVLYHKQASNQPPTRKAEQPTHNIKYNHNNFILFISPDFLLLPYTENLFFSVCNPIKLIFFAFIAEKNVIWIWFKCDRKCTLTIAFPSNSIYDWGMWERELSKVLYVAGLPVVGGFSLPSVNYNAMSVNHRQSFFIALGFLIYLIRTRLWMSRFSGNLFLC